jgi:hypothetical protein
VVITVMITVGLMEVAAVTSIGRGSCSTIVVVDLMRQSVWWWASSGVMLVAIGQVERWGLECLLSLHAARYHDRGRSPPRSP